MYRSTKGASKARRDQINAEIRNLKDLLPISEADKARLSYLHIMSLACMYTRKSVFFSQETETTGAGVESTRFMSFHELSQLVHEMPGFLLMVTSEGKLLFLSDSVTDHLGHSMVDLVAQGDSIYDIIDPTDHFVMRSNLAPATTPETDRLFRCRFNTSKSVRRQSAGSKLALVRAHCLSAAGGTSSYWTSNPVWLCFCSPLEGQASSSPVAQPAALPPPPADHAWFLAGFHSRHSQDMRVQEADDSVIVYLGYDVDALRSRSWYSLLHPQDLPHASAQHCSLLREGGEGRAEMVVRVETQDLSFTWLYMVLHLDTGENLIACRSYVVSESEAWSVRQQLCTEQTQLALVLSASASYQDSLGLQSPDTLSSPDQVFTPSSSGLSGQSFDFSAAASSLSSSEELGGAAAAESMQLEGPRSSLSSLEEEGFPQQGQQPPQPGEPAVAPPSVTPPTTTSASAELDFLFPPPSRLPLPPFSMPRPPQPVKDECACVCSKPLSAHAPRVGVSFTMGQGPLFNLSPTPSASAPTATRKAPPPSTVTMPLLASAWRPQLHLSLEPPSNCSRSGRGKYPAYEKLPPTPETPTGGVYEGDGGALLALPELQGPLYVELPPQGPFCCPLEGLLTPESSPAERPEVQPLCPKREGRSKVEIETESERERVEILNLAQHISYLADWFSPKLNTPSSSSIPAPLPEAPPAEQDPASPLGELYPVKPWRGGATDTPVSRFPDNGSLFEESLLESLLLDLLSDSIPLPPPLPSSPSTPPPPNPPTPVCWCPPPPQLEVGSLVGISHLCSVQSTRCNCVGVGGALATVSAEEEAAEDSPPIPESLAAALAVAPAAPSILTCGQQPLPGEPVAVETEPMSGAGAPVAPVPGHQPELHQLQRDPSPQHFLPEMEVVLRSKISL